MYKQSESPSTLSHRPQLTKLQFSYSTNIIPIKDHIQLLIKSVKMQIFHSPHNHMSNISNRTAFS